MIDIIVALSVALGLLKLLIGIAENEPIDVLIGSLVVMLSVMILLVSI